MPSYADARDLDNLRYYFNTRNDVIYLQVPGQVDGGPISNLAFAGRPLLIGTAENSASAGANGEGIRIESVVVETPYGHAVPISEMKKTLRKRTTVPPVFIQATESSTGVRNDVEASQNIGSPGMLSGGGPIPDSGHELHPDEWESTS